MDGATAAVELGRVLPIRLGTLRVYGDWFGRPMDNIHTAVSVEWTGNELVIAFDEGERLQVTNPSGIEPSLRSTHSPPRDCAGRPRALVLVLLRAAQNGRTPPC